VGESDVPQTDQNSISSLRAAIGALGTALPGAPRWRKALSYYWRRVVRLRATPHEVALGCALGVFAACTPFLGFQMALAGALALVLRVNIPAAFFGTFFGNPLSWPAIWTASYISGAWLFGHDPAAAAEQIAISANALGESLKTPSTMTLDTAVVNLSPILWPMVAGSTMIGLIAAASSYYPMRRAVRVFQKRRRRAL
jgi:uncharacterized protein (DUF2062 family)